jgi:SAM-dependent methyltransferase
MSDEVLSGLVKNIRGRTKAGSSVGNSVSYQELPFDFNAGLKSHRKGTVDRWLHFTNGIDVKGRTLLDIGCNVGSFAVMAAKYGASKSVGVDYDPQALAVGRRMAAVLHLNNIQFIESEINQELINSFDSFGITLWLSQWMWMAKKYGMEYAKAALFSMSKKSDIMIFESAADEGMAAIKGSTQADIEKWFNENTCYSKIRNIGHVGGWNPRNVFIGEARMMQWKGYTSSVERVSRDVVRKKYRPDFNWTIEREYNFLKKLEGSPYFPKVIDKKPAHLDLSFCGAQSGIKKPEDCLEILNVLEANEIIHRDIRPANILFLNGRHYLIDFGWSIWKSEEDTPVPHHKNLGGKYYQTSKRDDRAAMTMVLAEAGVK